MLRTTVIVFMLLMMIVKVESACNTELKNDLFQDLLNMMMKIKGYSPEVSTCSCQKNVIAFTTSVSAPKSIGPLEIVKFDKVWTNAGKGYDTNSGIFTAPKKGYYQISATIMSNHGKWFHASLWKNDEKTVGMYPGQGPHTSSASIVLKLKKGDRVFVKHHKSSQEIYSDENHYSMFSGFLIS
ncbi:complement C1q tumor necrosis factor-related protein 6-like [Mytilus californianus]|uniref:complement C1q tumor necrosis factor-related protein 6-like n=1 Tax=Mytilus californianus TaxID=6549 RepID=UPI002247ECD0|nr:complement C1q tumor necrosis factor-related protein 6-like [Mytilus californianus]